MVFFKTPTADIKKPEGYFILCLFVYLVFTLSVLTTGGPGLGGGVGRFKI